jgi:hypothetical protein
VLSIAARSVLDLERIEDIVEEEAASRLGQVRPAVFDRSQHGDHPSARRAVLGRCARARCSLRAAAVVRASLALCLVNIFFVADAAGFFAFALPARPGPGSAEKCLMVWRWSRS